MKNVILLILGAMWAAVGYSWLRSRSGPRGTNSIAAFSDHLTVLARTTPGRNGAADDAFAARRPVRPAPAAGLNRRQAQKRRRDILFGLVGALGVFLLLAFAAGGIFVGLTVITLALLGGYVALLARMHKLAQERQAKVRYLPQVPAPVAYDDHDEVDDHQVLLLQRSAN